MPKYFEKLGADLKSTLRNSSHLSASLRRSEDVKMLGVTLFTEQGRCWEYSWYYKLLTPFLLHEKLFCFQGRVVDPKVPNHRILNFFGDSSFLTILLAVICHEIDDISFWFFFFFSLSLPALPRHFYQAWSLATIPTRASKLASWRPGTHFRPLRLYRLLSPRNTLPSKTYKTGHHGNRNHWISSYQDNGILFGKSRGKKRNTWGGKRNGGDKNMYIITVYYEVTTDLIKKWRFI